jgi:hypothetical protein
MLTLKEQVELHRKKRAAESEEAPVEPAKGMSLAERLAAAAAADVD